MNPALTKEEWTGGRHGEPGTLKRGSGRYAWDAERFRDLFEGHITKTLAIRVGQSDKHIAILEPEDAHALAALCLHQQPYGFTREDGALLRDLYRQVRGCWPEDAWDEASAAPILGLADKIEALLPPEEVP